MGFLKRFLKYQNICIQCHNNPDADALASAYGLFCYFTAYGVQTRIVYGGEFPIKKYSVQYLAKQCEIPAEHVRELPETQLLLVVDGQYGAGNVERFEAPEIAVIDHHFQRYPDGELVLIKSDYQSCSTIVWELLKEEGYPVEKQEPLCVALLYGLYTDTGSYADLYRKKDLAMYAALTGEYPLLEKLKKSSMTLAELMIATDAMQNQYVDVGLGYAIISAIHCEQAVLGVLGDFVIQVDLVRVTVAYTEIDGGYQLSIRSCEPTILANRLMETLCDGIGSGGGHVGKAGGRIFAEKLREKFGDRDLFDVIKERLETFLEGLNA